MLDVIVGHMHVAVETDVRERIAGTSISAVV